MPANTAPVYSLTPNIGRVAVTAANTSSAGGGTIGTDIFLAFTAGANGAWITKIRLNPVATVAATVTAATTHRVFLSTKASGATTGGTDTFLFQELAASAVTADATTAAVASLEIPCNFALNANQTILVTTHIALVANTSWQIEVFGGDY